MAGNKLFFLNKTFSVFCLQRNFHFMNRLMVKNFKYEEKLVTMSLSHLPL